MGSSSGISWLVMRRGEAKCGASAVNEEVATASAPWTALERPGVVVEVLEAVLGTSVWSSGCLPNERGVTVERRPCNDKGQRTAESMALAWSASTSASS